MTAEERAIKWCKETRPLSVHPKNCCFHCNAVQAALEAAEADAYARGAAEMRERCAKEGDELANEWYEKRPTGKDIADAIRALTPTKDTHP